MLSWKFPPASEERSDDRRRDPPYGFFPNICLSLSQGSTSGFGSVKSIPTMLQNRVGISTFLVMRGTSRRYGATRCL